MPFPLTHPALARALETQGYKEPTPVQSAVLEPETIGRDLLVSAQTGSGKTVAYGLAFAETLLGEETRFPAPTTPLALIIAPTRELAMQVHRELSWLYAQTGAKIVSCIGGMDGRAEARALENGCHIVVGTPGRLCDHLERNRLKLSNLRVAVLDEADEMMKLGFREELERLLMATPATRRTLLFSATIAKDIAALAKQYQNNALRIDTLVRNQPHADIEYRAVRVAPHDMEHAVVNVLRYFEAPTALVFCSTRDEVRHLYGSLRERGFTVVAMSGELTQSERTRALESMRDGQARVCVATDVAARGIDLPELLLVIHASLPTNAATLLHRSGRTGRAGRKGTSVLIVPYNRQRRGEQLLATAGVSANWSGPPLAQDISEKDSQRLLQDPILTQDSTPEDLVQARVLLEGRTAEDIAAAFIRLHRARLPAAEEIAEPINTPERARPRSDKDAPNRPERVRPPRAVRKDHSESENSAPRKERPSTSEGMTWFRMNVGRRNKADPKWLVPLICRLGNVQKQDIGSIRIFDGETKFEIKQSLAESFTASLPAPGTDEVQVSPAGAPTSAPRREAPPNSRGAGAFRARKHAKSGKR